MTPGPYEVQFTETALKNLQRYPKPDRERILSKIESLAVNPPAAHNVKRLVDFDAAAFRLRVGNYRVLYDLVESHHLIDVIDILPRRLAYKKR
jgi:mRNA interferase RelE/StbE